MSSECWSSESTGSNPEPPPAPLCDHVPHSLRTWMMLAGLMGRSPDRRDYSPPRPLMRACSLLLVSSRLCASCCYWTRGDTESGGKKEHTALISAVSNHLPPPSLPRLTKQQPTGPFLSLPLSIPFSNPHNRTTCPLQFLLQIHPSRFCMTLTVVRSLVYRTLAAISILRHWS